ncbi:carbohydrate ABC transporter membrane protein 2 (CUT1 family) [Isoptericola jiangsuensis]|uniref:Carbohydrate ABC transporter membrane protein 2 (CUT1 family) n=1 Tax=Isoptericola jiangsuensis TaxID=548579 RepID=A0A2A9EWB1_9MICO|nr:carbohydrate ABC transporter permease [Isoptericola jiangsuensis]PFG42570.1 carbohydrate ABC transporter membrane protein 2 (CUT1 family) [Isoptericola jiangsuensis]
MSAATTSPVPATDGASAPGTPTGVELRPAPRRRFRPGKVLLSLLGIAVALAWVFPVYWMLLSAVTPNARLRSTTPTFLPIYFTTSNFESVITDGGFTKALGMSLMITGVTLVCVLVFAFFGALAISRWKFRGRTAFILAVLFIQMLPAEGLFIAQYKMLSTFGETAPMFGLNSVLGISILYTAMLIPFTIWMLRGFVAGVPAELEEAAMVDGLSRTKAFIRITFPLLAPGLVASGVYAFLQAWNEFTTALVVLPAESKQTLPVWLRSFLSASANQGINWAEVMAASTLIAIPVIVFFMIVQGRMTSGLVSGAVKG